MMKYSAFPSSIHNANVDRANTNEELHLNYIKESISTGAKDILNVYIETPELLDFLENQKISDGDLNIISKICIDGIGRFNFKGKLDFAVNNPRYNIHLPGRRLSFFCELFVGGVDRNDIYDAGDVRITMLSFHKKGHLIFEHFNKSINIIGIKQQLNAYDYAKIKIFLNMLLYIDAFPLCLIDGVPSGDCSKRILKISEKLKNDYRTHGGLKSPHLRRGHFRFLQSDRYKNKRYETIYIANNG